MIATLRSLASGCIVVALVARRSLLAACGSSSKSDSSGDHGGGSARRIGTLNGSGSTFQQTFNQAAIAAFQDANSGITVNYAGDGSGKGKTDLQTKTVDFAGTDSLVEDADELASTRAARSSTSRPSAAPITVSFNLSGVTTLQLSGETLAKIFSGTIKKWNDAAIKADNPGVTLPSTDITIVHRSDSSGTTSNFTKFLADGRRRPLDARQRRHGRLAARARRPARGNAGCRAGRDADRRRDRLRRLRRRHRGQAAVRVDQEQGGQVRGADLAGAAAAVATRHDQRRPHVQPAQRSRAPTSYPITSPTWIIVYENQTDTTRARRSRTS